MVNGGIMRADSSEWPQFIPSPGVAWHNESDGKLWPPLKTTQEDAEQTYERVCSTHALASQGFWDAADATAAGLFESPKPNALRAVGEALRLVKPRPSLVAKLGYIPKYIATAEQHGAPFREIPDWCFWPDYFPMAMLGILAQRNPRRWLPHALEISTPTMGKATSLPDLAARLDREAGNILAVSQVVALRSALQIAGY